MHGNRCLGRSQRILSPFPQIIAICKSERTVEIGPHFDKVVVKIEAALFFLLGHDRV